MWNVLKKWINWRPSVFQSMDTISNLCGDSLWVGWGQQPGWQQKTRVRKDYSQSKMPNRRREVGRDKIKTTSWRGSLGNSPHKLALQLLLSGKILPALMLTCLQGHQEITVECERGERLDLQVCKLFEFALSTAWLCQQWTSSDSMAVWLLFCSPQTWSCSTNLGKLPFQDSQFTYFLFHLRLHKSSDGLQQIICLWLQWTSLGQGSWMPDLYFLLPVS